MLQAPRSRLLLKLTPVQASIPNRTIANTFATTRFLPHSKFPIYNRQPSIRIQTTRTMSSFSNADTGSKPADPYKATNLDESSLEDKFSALEKFIDSRKFGMMTTRDPNAGRLVSRCMAVAAKEKNGTEILFFTNTESNKTNELKADPQINISFLDAYGQWASVAGSTSIETDRSTIKKHYTPDLRAWLGDLGDGTHDGSENDPRVGVIRVKMDTATYAVTEKTMLGFAAEVAKGTVTGNTASVHKLREINPSEVQQWASKA